jgi:ribosome-associated protein
MPNSNRDLTDFQSATPVHEKPSKSQRKRDMTALQKLGQLLVEAPAERVKRINLPENLKTAIFVCRSIKSHGGRRRQLQFIGKIMRELDETEIAIINKAIESWHGQSKAETAAMHALERQRERLLTQDAALAEFLAQHPQTDSQHLRHLIRNAKKELAENKPPKAYREIFQILKQIQAESTEKNDHA